VVVGGLGLGYTAQAALDDDRVRSVLVVDAVDAVIDWHQRGLLPFAHLGEDPRCRLLHGDFFALTATPAGYDAGRTFDAILLDVDHSPRHLLHPRHEPFYTAAGLRQLAGHLKPGGVFGLWSNDPPDEPFLSLLATVFPTARAEIVEFDNPLQKRLSTNTIYLAGPA
jgi:spermidine synthase